ncbi:PAS domain-containing protein [Thalassospira sp. MA62]|nr:PAS domain-containing protein [Thalassospira sp. MA62]
MTNKHSDALPSGKERHFDSSELIVSKTDLKGRITYANEVFLRLSDYREDDVLGQPHSIIRHPDMPRCIFKLMWDTLGSGREIFAFVVNMAQNGDHYWVLAHVTPSFDANHNIVGYHSNRRVPNVENLQNTIIPLYRELRAIEESLPSRKDGLKASTDALHAKLKDRGMEYDKFIQSL